MVKVDLHHGKHCFNFDQREDRNPRLRRLKKHTHKKKDGLLETFNPNTMHVVIHNKLPMFLHNLI